MILSASMFISEGNESVKISLLSFPPDMAEEKRGSKIVYFCIPSVILMLWRGLLTKVLIFRLAMDINYWRDIGRHIGRQIVDYVNMIIDKQKILTHGKCQWVEDTKCQHWQENLFEVSHGLRKYVMTIWLLIFIVSLLRLHLWLDNCDFPYKSTRCLLQ